MTPLAYFLSLPLRDRIVILAGSLVAAFGAWCVVLGVMLLGAS